MRNNDLEILTNNEHVLECPGMFVGDVSNMEHYKWVISKDNRFIKQQNIKFTPAILKLFDEIISNSIDEALRTNFKKANIINININNDKIKISDNGRGISNTKILDKTSNKMISQALAAFTILNAGSNFGERDFASIGAHGLGASVVNILSSKFSASTTNNKTKTDIICTNNMSQINHKETKVKTTKTGTIVEFIPDFNQFGCNNLDENHILMIKKRIYDLAVSFPKIKFKLNNQIILSKDFNNYLKMYSDTYEYIENNEYKIAVFPAEEQTQISFVNGVDTYEGGTHVDYVRNKIVKAVLDKLNKKYKKLQLKPLDIKSKLGIVVITNNINNCQYRSQTKEYLTNSPSEFGNIFLEVDSSRFINKILKNLDIIDPILETKKLKAAANNAVELKRQNRRIKRLKIPNHIPANGPKSKRILHICEGQSALGQLCNVRDDKIHGGYPLKGKPLNIYGKSFNVISKNKELSELMHIIGLQLNKPASNLNYSKIRLMADADHDGNAIVALLCNFFSLWPELYEQELIELIISPIVTAHKGKIVKRFYDINEYHKNANKLKSYKIKYNKGLGSLNKSEYSEMLNNPVLKVIKWTDLSKNSLDLVFNDKPEGRKQWLKT